MAMSGKSKRSIEQIAREVGRYPPDAYYFVQEGLSHTVQRVHGDPAAVPEGQRHVTGQQLSWGLAELALEKWGLLAPVVLQRWNITNTLDFGRIVFAMVEHSLMRKRPTDRLEDFLDVYDFRKVFDKQFQIATED